ncbi:hypothetical protein D3C76_170710 [compost metagenome]
MNISPEETMEDVFTITLPPRPYPGLRPFEKQEWPIFFGRERMADAVVNGLIDKHLLVVHGDSGCGKSSLIRAAVLPRLEQENARAGLRWRTCTVFPREAPLLNMAKALAGLCGKSSVCNPMINLRRALNFGSTAPAVIAQITGASHSENICILIDQFEELFGHARRHGPEEAQLLTQFLTALQRNPQPGLYVVLTMRSEFLGTCAHYDGLAEVVNATQYLLPRMDHSDLLRAICEPARLYNGQVSRDLADRLIIDAGGGQDRLPLIQHGLMLLHRQAVPVAVQASLECPAWHLGLEHYNPEHRLTGLLSSHADCVLQRIELPPDDPVVEDVFRALTDVNAEGQAIRRPQTLEQLIGVTGAEAAQVRAIVESFRADGVSFLSPHDPSPLGMDSLIDISHEAFIRCWHKIADPVNGWLMDEFRDGLIWHSLLMEADSFERNPNNVIGPDVTDEREQLLKRHNPVWALRYGGGWDRVKRLLDASALARDLTRERIKRQQRKQEFLKGLSAGLAALLLALVGSGYVWSFRTQLLAKKSELETASQQLKEATDTLNSTYKKIDFQLNDVAKKHPTLEKPINEVRAELKMGRALKSTEQPDKPVM